MAAADKTTYTPAGELWTMAEARQLAQLIHKRLGQDLHTSAAAWRQLLGNTCTADQFAALLLHREPK